MRNYLVMILLTVLGLAACSKQETSINSPLPVIEFLSMGKDTIKAGSTTDSASIVFKFKDGDGDIGSDLNNGNFDIFITNTRDPVPPDPPDTFRYKFPYIPDGFKDSKKGIEGFTRISISSAILVFPDTIAQSETFRFKLYILDKGRHPSNLIETPDITLVR